MADTIRRVSYYYTTISDKPGEGARLLETLRSAGVNLLAVHAFPSARKAQVDFVPSAAVNKTASEGTKSTCALRALGKAWTASRFTPALLRVSSRRAPSPGLSDMVV